MKDDFDHIINQLLSNLPQHSPKSEVWDKINSGLDENIAMTRLKRILKNNEHKPKTDLWPAIESSLNKPVFWKTFYQSAWVKFVVPSLIVLTTLVFVVPFLSPDRKVDYTNPLQREFNSAEIFSENTNTTTFRNPVNIFPNNAVIVAGENSGRNINNYANTFADKNDQGHSDQQNEENRGVQDVSNDLRLENTDVENVSGMSATGTYNKNIHLICPLPLFGLSDTGPSGNEILSHVFSSPVSGFSSGKGLGQGNFSLELSYAPGISFMKLKNNPGDFNIDLEKRRQAELPSCSWSAGVEGKIDFNHWFFQAGLNYSKISTVSEYRYKYSSVDTLGWLLTGYTILDSAGTCFDTIYYSWSPITGLVSYDYKKKASCQINYMQIPLIAGYSVSRGKFQYSVSGGVSLGMPLSITGRMIEPDNYTISGVTHQDIPLRKIVYNGLLRAGVNYVVSPRYSLFVQPSVGFTLNSVFEKKYPVNQKYLTYGLRMGVSYRF